MNKKTPHIIFYGYYKSFNYYKIGGLESLYRRMALMLTDQGCKVSFVFYGGDLEENHQITNLLSLRYFKKFSISLSYLINEASLVFDNYLLKKDRIIYDLFRIKHNQELRFGHIYAGVPKRMVQKLHYIRRKSIPFNGPVLSLSNTIQKKLLKNGIDSVVMYPSIPDSYCMHPKDTKKPLRLTFMGRFDENKGIYEVISLFKKVSESHYPIDICVSGYYGHGNVNKEKLEKSFGTLPKLNVQEQNWDKWGPKMDEHVIELLQKTDILILPYPNLLGTMDPPLLVLEGMACGCAVLTTDVGSVKEFYGDSIFINDHDMFVEKSHKLITQILIDKRVLEIEQERIFKKLKTFKKRKQTGVSYLFNKINV